jgi:transcription elongation factor GreA-like protein
MELNGAEIVPNGELTGNEPSYNMLKISPEKQLKHDYAIRVNGAAMMQQSRANMLDQMIRLMQTPAEDGMPAVPREAVLDYLPDVNKRRVIQYFQKLKQESMDMKQQEGINNQIMEQVQALGEQVGQIGQAVAQIQNKLQQEDEEYKRDQIMAQGYQQGLNEAKALQLQIEKSGKLPPELLQQIATMDDEELGELLSKYPEIADMI